MARVMANLERLPRDIDRYMQLSSLQERNGRLFYRAVIDHIETQNRRAVEDELVKALAKANVTAVPAYAHMKPEDLATPGSARKKAEELGWTPRFSSSPPDPSRPYPRLCQFTHSLMEMTQPISS